MERNELNEQIRKAERTGFLQGIKIMEQRMLLACENGTPIDIEGTAFFIQSDLQNLRHIFDDLAAEV